MSIKPFAIQGSDLTLGGVNLSAGTTGVVIPGVTQATNYRAEEVERRITIGGNNPNTFGSNTNLVYVMDNADYVYRSGGAQPSGTYQPAIYNVDKLDDGRIEEVDVESGGTFAAADKTRVEAADMWAIRHALGEDPLDPFVAGDWTQIPYRPKMRAGAVENVGGGGNANTGNFTFSDDTISNDNDASIVVGDPVVTFEVNAVDEFGPPDGPGGVWRLFIGVDAYPTLGTTVQIGDTVTTSWGTPITATIVDIQQDDDWQIHVDQDITAGHNDYDTVTFSSVANKTWTFGQDGSLTLPNGMSIDGYGTLGVNAVVGIGGDDTRIDIDNNGAPPGLTITTNGTAGMGQRQWRFGPDGDLTFPDGSIQTTAYTGDGAAGTFFVVANDDGTVSKSTDGVTWTAGVDTGAGIDRVATDGVTVAMIQSSQLSWTTFAGLEASTYVSGTSNINDQIGERSISWNQIDYAGGYFVAVGSYTPIVDGFTQGVYGYSTDGRVWTFMTVDQTVVEFFGNDPVDSDWEFSDVDYNGVGWMFSVSGDGPSNPQGGGVYITDLTAAVTSARCFSMSLTYNAAWNGSAWYMEGGDGGGGLGGVNTNLDPRNGTFVGPIDPWDTDIQDLGINAGGTVELAGGNGYIAASDSDGHVAWSDDNGVTWQIVTPIPYTRTISAITQASPAVVSFSGSGEDADSAGEKIIISGSSVAGYNGTFYWDSTSNSLYTDQTLITPFDTSGLAPFTGTATLTWSNGQYIDAMDYINGYFYIGNDDEQIARTTNFVSWTILDDQNNDFEYWNDIAGFVSTGGTESDRLVNGAQEFTLNADGSVTFPDGSIQTTAYTGSGTSGDANIWIQTFESQAGAPTDVVAIAASVEYDSAGNVIALFGHYDSEGGNTYYSVGKYTTTGTKIWTARFDDDGQDLDTDGWGLAVDNATDSIYVAGQSEITVGGQQWNATLTKLDAADGTIVWSKKYDFGYTSLGSVVDVASDGNPVMVGYASNGDDRYVATTKVDAADGSIIWSRALNGQNDEKAYGMAVGPDGEVVAIGYMENLGMVNTAATLYADPVSNVLWTEGGSILSVGGVTADFTFTDGIPTFTNVVDTVGNRSVDDVIITVLGDNLGGVTGVDDMVVKVGSVTAGNSDDHMLVVKYASDGTIAWQKAILFDAGFDCRGADADIDSDGNIYVTGSYQYNSEFGGTTSALSILKLDSTGVKQWSRRITGTCETFGVSVVVGADDKLYLSAITGFAGGDTDETNGFTWVAAKYGFDGTVEWQRLIERTDTWTFAGGLFFNDGGGSNLAVKDGYVVLGGGFGLIGGDAQATVIQVAATGDTFSTGPWAFTAASFSGLLNSSASDITVSNALKTDTDNVSNISVATVTPIVDISAFLLGTLYVGGDASNQLVNGTYSVTLENTGTVTLPAGGTITEGYVTSNPTIQLTPAAPTVASQKLVIKGGGSYDYTDNGININYYTNTAIVGDTLTFYINSPTYAGQTLYWWIYPEGANISDPGSGTVVLDGSSGIISFVLDSDDNEFTLRVSPEANNYDPLSLGVESGLINPDAPTFDFEHHLHLTTGDLTETSIFLGTDNHNVRTNTDGNIQVTTTYYGAVSSVASVNSQGGYNTGTYTGLTTTGGTGSGLTVNATSAGGYIGVITVVNPGKGYTDDDVITLVGGDGLGCTFVVNVPVGTSEWTFAADGSITFPTQTTPDYANRTNGYATGPTLQLADNGTDGTVVITGPATTLASPYAKRLVIQGQPGWRGSNIGTNGTEGGDVYIWGGYGGEGSNYTGDGGDVKLRGGHGGQSGGYVRIESGLAKDGDGVGGFLDLNAGDATASGGIGGPVEIRGGRGVASGGAVNIHTATTNIFNNQWTFANDGSLTLPKNSSVSEVTPATGAAAVVAVIQMASSIANVSFVSVPPAPILDYTVPGTDIVVDVNWNANGSEYYSPRFTVVDGGTGHTGGGQFGGGEVLTVPYADMGITTGGNWTWYVVDIASDLVLEAGLKDWTFAADGVITLPNSMTIGSYGTLGENAFLEIGGDDTRIGIDNDGAPPGFSITTNATGGMAQRVWRFGPDGDLTLPGAVVKSTVAKTGVILPTTTGIPLTLSGGMTGLSLADGTYGPVTIGGVTFSVTVTGGGISGYINISSTTPYAVYDTIGQLTSAALGDTPGQTTNVAVDSVVQATPTALDLTKSVNKLTDGDYTLADGVEGQIMYLVRQNGSTAHNVTVANVRLDGTDYTDVSFTPFTDGTDPTNMATLIFTDSAWQSMGGVWNFT